MIRILRALGRWVEAYPWPWISERELCSAFDLLDQMGGTHLAMDSPGRAEDMLGWMP